MSDSLHVDSHFKSGVFLRRQRLSPAGDHVPRQQTYAVALLPAAAMDSNNSSARPLTPSERSKSGRRGEPHLRRRTSQSNSTDQPTRETDTKRVCASQTAMPASV